MQYLLMCCCDEDLWAKLAESEQGRIMSEYGKLIHELKTSGRLLAASLFARRTGSRSSPMGRLRKTKEQLGGYHLIECQDRDEAIAIALRIPTLPIGGSIEVRPLLHME
jgi:hypothetical protein